MSCQHYVLFTFKRQTYSTRVSSLIALNLFPSLCVKQCNLSTFVTRDDFVTQRSERSHGGFGTDWREFSNRLVGFCSFWTLVRLLSILGRSEGLTVLAVSLVADLVDSNSTLVTTSLFRDTQSKVVVVAADANKSQQLPFHGLAGRTHLHATRLTAVGNSQVFKHSPVLISHNFIVLSAAPESSNLDWAVRIIPLSIRLFSSNLAQDISQLTIACQ
jgi:hypothetical protein